VTHKLFILVTTVAFIGLVAHRVWNAGALPPQMPAQLPESEEQALHLSPAGKYTMADIVANGRMVPSQKYRGFQARHDYDPAIGDRLCPVTRTKANASCTWSINGQVYEFCCPPCIDEFVKLAKQYPDRLLPPDAYVKTNESAPRAD
jgi:hypothetical protein